MMKKALFLAGVLAAKMAFAADSPIGQWETIDDETNKARSVVEIYEKADGTIAGKVVELFKNPNAVCKKCDGKRKNQPIQGMEVLWGLKDDGDEWAGGRILDPEKGKTYRAAIKVINGGKALKVTGKLLVFSRSQIWKKR